MLPPLNSNNEVGITDRRAQRRAEATGMAKKTRRGILRPLGSVGEVDSENR